VIPEAEELVVLLLRVVAVKLAEELRTVMAKSSVQTD